MSTVTIGMTKKRINSTSRVIQGATSVDAKLKTPCSTHAPVFQLKGITDAMRYNYLIWRGGYYWVDDVVSITNDIWEVHARLDPLATFSGSIKTTNALVLFGDSAHWNKVVDDLRFSPEREQSTSYEQFDPYGTAFTEDGTIIMRYMSCGSDKGCKTIAMTRAHFDSMLSDLSANLSGLTMEQIIAKIGGYGSWRDNIISVTYLPLNYSMYGGSESSTITLGGIDNVPCIHKNVATNQIWKNTQGSISLTWEQMAEDLPFLKNDRWSSFQIVTPSGYTNISSDLLKNQSNLYYGACINQSNGDYTIKFTEYFNAAGTVLASFGGNMGVDLTGSLPNGQNFTTGLGNALSFGTKLAGTAMSLGMSAASMSMANQNLNSTILNKSDPTQWASAYQAADSAKMSFGQSIVSGISGCGTLGGNMATHLASGNLSGNLTSFFMTGTPGRGYFVRKLFVYDDISHYEDYCNEYGYPCNKYLTLGSIDGYCQCSGASVSDIPGASESDKSTINSYLNSGIYIED